MAKLLMVDGNVIEVEYNKAAKIYQILIGNKEPENKNQAELCERVATVKFDRLKAKSETYSATPKEPDIKMKELIENENLKGYAKFTAIGNRLKDRLS